MELIIKNGSVVSSKETKKADIYIKDGKIAEISASINKAGVQVIDASARIVMPGGVDVHTHLDMPFMGSFSTDDFYTGTVAAAFGGTTSIIDYVIPEKSQSLLDAVNVWHEKAKDKAVLDYGFHLVIVPPIETTLAEISQLPEMGITSIKCFMAYKNALMLDDRALFKLLRKSVSTGMLVCVHAENGDIIDVLTRKTLQEGKTEPIYHALTRPANLEGEAAGRIIKLAESLRAPLYFVHVSTSDAVSEISKAKNNNQKIFSETCPQYLLLDSTRYQEPDFEGAKYVMSPPLRDETHLEYLFEAILEEDEIDVIATDHCPFNFNKEKQNGKDDFTKIPNGIPGIETRMPLMYSELVVNKGLPINKFVELTCTKPAKIFGMTNKGDIKVGMDADIAIWDAEQKWTISVDNLHQNVDYTPFEGLEVTGKPITVISRGNIVIENNELKANAGIGQFVKREKSQ